MWTFTMPSDNQTRTPTWPMWPCVDDLHTQHGDSSLEGCITGGQVGVLGSNHLFLRPSFFAAKTHTPVVKPIVFLTSTMFNGWGYTLRDGSPTLWLLHIAMAAMAHRNRWFSQLETSIYHHLSMGFSENLPPATQQKFHPHLSESRARRDLRAAKVSLGVPSWPIHFLRLDGLMVQKSKPETEKKSTLRKMGQYLPMFAMILCYWV